jgi:3-hydroxyisobutyrate dehydrogenase
MKVGLIGYGRIGGTVACHIARAGHAVAVHDVREGLAGEVAAAGMAWCKSAAEVAAASEIVLDCVYGPAAVEAVLHGTQGLLTGAHDGLTLVEMTTIDPALARRNAQLVAKRGIAYLDAPVTGGIEGAQAGTLALLVGGEEAVIDRVRPVLDCFADRIFHLGEAGTGSTMKAVVQAVFLLQMAAFTEAIALGEAAGLELKPMLEVLGASTSHHPTIGKRYAQILAGDTTPRFEVAGAAKDLAAVQKVAEAAGIAPGLTNAGAALYRRAAELGHGSEDLWTAIAAYRDR